jgi:hypothetical protein
MSDSVNYKMSQLPTPVMRPVIPGIVADARRLGVTRQHLHAVLNGRRFSPGLVSRYKKLRRVS